jgi:septal ring factor EnvC (AmiA/AmiB activator)
VALEVLTKRVDEFQKLLDGMRSDIATLQEQGSSYGKHLKQLQGHTDEHAALIKQLAQKQDRVVTDISNLKRHIYGAAGSLAVISEVVRVFPVGQAPHPLLLLLAGAAVGVLSIVGYSAIKRVRNDTTENQAP